MRKLIIFIFFIPVFLACKHQKPENMDEGIISYKIDYPETIKKKGFASFLPTKMVGVFKKENYKLSIKGELSLYQLDYISRLSGDSAATLFRIFDKRMFHKHENNEHLFLFRKYEETKVEYVKNETKEIAGYLCKKAMISYSNPELKPSTVFYCEEINFNRPKENSPFDEIPGALMEFQVHFKGLQLNFVAHDVDIKEINEKDFKIPDNYSPTEEGEIDELVSTLIQ